MFRHGHLIIAPTRLRAVLTGLALPVIPGGSGWICVNSWPSCRDRQAGLAVLDRAKICLPVERAGPRVDPAGVMFWEVMGTLLWGRDVLAVNAAFRKAPTFD